MCTVSATTDLYADPDYVRSLKVHVHHPEAVSSGTAASVGTLSSGTGTSKEALSSGTAARGGILGCETVTSRGAAVNVGVVSSGASSGPMSGGACCSGEPLLDDLPFADDFTPEQLDLFNSRLSAGYEQVELAKHPVVTSHLRVCLSILWILLLQLHQLQRSLDLVLDCKLVLTH